MNKTIAQVVEEYRNRQNPQFEDIGVIDSAGRYECFSNPSNITEHKDNNGWCEFDTTVDITRYYKESTITTRHMKMHMARIVRYTEIISDVKKNA